MLISCFAMVRYGQDPKLISGIRLALKAGMSRGSPPFYVYLECLATRTLDERLGPKRCTRTLATGSHCGLLVTKEVSQCR